MSFSIVVDSTVDLPADYVKSEQIKVVPVHVIYGDTTYFDGQITQEEFLKKSQRNKKCMGLGLIK